MHENATDISNDKNQFYKNLKSFKNNANCDSFKKLIPLKPH